MLRWGRLMTKAKQTSPQKYHPTHHGPEIFPRRRTFTPEENQWREAVMTFSQNRGNKCLKNYEQKFLASLPNIRAK